jgi:hypothetical protein
VVITIKPFFVWVKNQSHRILTICSIPLITTILAGITLLTFFFILMHFMCTSPFPDLTIFSNSTNKNLWYVYSLGGMPSYGSLLLNSIYDYLAFPINWLFQTLHLPNILILSMLLIVLLIIFFIMMRNMGIEAEASAFSAFMIIFLPQLFGFSLNGEIKEIIALILLPLIFLLTKKLLEVKNSTYFCLFVLTLGFQMLLGKLVITYYTLFFIIILFVFELLFQWEAKSDNNKLSVSCLLFFSAIVCSILLASVLYFSILDWNRFAIQEMSTLEGKNILENNSFHPLEILTYFIPSFLGMGSETYWGKMAQPHIPYYFGIIVLYLAGCAVLIRRDRYMNIFLTISLISFILSLGTHISWWYSKMINFFPLLNTSHTPSSFQILLEISIIILAGFGFHEMLTMKNYAAKLKIIMTYSYSMIFFILLLLIFLLAKSGYLHYVAKEQVHLTFIKREVAYHLALIDCVKALALIISIHIFITLYYKQKFSRLIFSVLVIGFSIVDLWLVNFNVKNACQQIPETNKWRDNPAVQLISGDTDIFRVFPILNDHCTNWTAAFTIQNIVGCHSSRLKIYQDFLDETGYHMSGRYGMNSFLSKYQRVVVRDNRIIEQYVPVQQISPQRLEFDYAMLDMLNVKYLLCDTFPLNDPRFRLLIDEPPRLYENTSALPRAFFADSVEILSSKRRIFDRMKDGTFNPRSVAIIEETPPFQISPSDSNRVKIVHYSPHNIVLSAEINKPTILILSEIYYPSGWKAVVDGIGTKIFKTNYILRSIFLSPGKHHIEFTFTPMFFVIGLLMSITTFVGLVGVLISNAWKKRKELFH